MVAIRDDGGSGHDPNGPTNVYDVLNENSSDFTLVRPGEVCSIEIAKELGIFDPRTYYNESIENTRTYGTDVPGDAHRARRLCEEITDNNAGQVLCPLVSPGLQAFPIGGAASAASTASELGFTVTAQDDGLTACKYPKCPPGFTILANGECKKPMIRNIVPKDSQCQEQWHDWFTAPNYHFGNNFEKVDGTCRAPCPTYHVPMNGTDPDNGNNRGETHLDKCVDKIEYMGGKFMGDSDFCTIAWVKRLGATPQSIADENADNYPQYILRGSPQVRDGAIDTVNRVVSMSHSRIENVGPDSGVQAALCKERVETPERLGAAYDTCKALHANSGKTDTDVYRDYADRMRMMKSNITDAEIQQKWRVLHQACHYAFCDESSGSDRAMRIGKPSLCFPKEAVARVDLTSSYNATRLADAYTFPTDNAYDEPMYEFRDVKVDVNRTYRRIGDFFVFICITVITVVTFYYFFYFARRALFPRWSDIIDEETENLNKATGTSKLLHPQRAQRNREKVMESNPLGVHNAKVQVEKNRSWDIWKFIFSNPVMVIIMKYVVFFLAILFIIMLLYGAFRGRRRSPMQRRTRRSKCELSLEGCGTVFGVPIPGWRGRGGGGGDGLLGGFSKYNAKDYATTIPRDQDADGRCDNKTLVEVGDQCAVAALPPNIEWKLDLDSAEFNRLPKNLQQIIRRFDTIEIPWVMADNYLVPDCAAAFYKGDAEKLAVQGLEDGGDVCRLVAVDPPVYGDRVRMKGAALDDWSDIEYADCGENCDE